MYSENEKNDKSRSWQNIYNVQYCDLRNTYKGTQLKLFFHQIEIYNAVTCTSMSVQRTKMKLNCRKMQLFCKFDR